MLKELYTDKMSTYEDIKRNSRLSAELREAGIIIVKREEPKVVKEEPLEIIKRDIHKLVVTCFITYWLLGLLLGVSLFGIMSR
jgi:hypothetical protein